MTKKLRSLLTAKSGILLDIGCGQFKQTGFVGMDRRKIPGVDIVHDLEVFPYPLPDESCLTIVGSHIVEHLKPWLMIQFMDELWRITKPNGQLYLSHPYSVNEYFVQDPTHCNPCNEATWQYFDHTCPLYEIYQPKPWKLDPGPVWQCTGTMEVMFRKVTLEQVGKNSNGK